MSKKSIVVLIIVLVLVAGVFFCLGNRLSVLITALSGNEEEIAAAMEQSRIAAEENLSRLGVDTSLLPGTGLTEELLQGEISTEEAMERFTSDQAALRPASQTTDDQTQTDQDSRARTEKQIPDSVAQDVNEESGNMTSEKTDGDPLQSTSDTARIDWLTYDNPLDACVYELYCYEIELMGQLGVLRQQAIDEWNALPEEQRTNTEKYRIGMEGLQKCRSLETEADKRVHEILDSWEEQLTEYGCDSSTCDSLWETYVSEKESLEAYYISLYLN